AELDPDAVRQPDSGETPCARVGDSTSAGVCRSAQTSGGTPMDVLLPVGLTTCCGIAVPKKTLTACLLQTAASGETIKEIRVFRTTTTALEELARWRVGEQCRPVAIESTGVYWKPVSHILEKAGREVMLVNAQPVQNVPGRKTDVQDAEWFATLLRV